MDRLIVAITGTPCTGKTLFAKRLAKKIRGSRLVEINDLVNRYELYSKIDRDGTKIVDIGRLSKKLSLKLKSANGTVLVVGHLAPELRFRCDVAIVTRCKLLELSKRLDKRKYHKEKAAENIVAEATDYCGLRMLEKCKETYEVETDLEKKRLMNYVIALSNGENAGKPRKRQINMLMDLLKLVKNGNRYGL